MQSRKTGIAPVRQLTPTREGMMREVGPSLATRLYELGSELLAASHKMQQGKMDITYSELAQIVQAGALDISMLAGIMVALENQKDQR